MKTRFIANLTLVLWALIIGLAFSGLVIGMANGLSILKGTFGMPGIIAPAWLIGAVIGRLFYGIGEAQDEREKAEQERFSRFKRNYELNSAISIRPPNEAELKAYLDTPAGVDTIYRLIRNRSQKREAKKAQETSALAAKASANKEQSKSYFNDEQKAAIEKNSSVKLIVVDEPKVSEMLTKNNVRHFRGKTNEFLEEVAANHDIHSTPR